MQFSQKSELTPAFLPLKILKFEIELRKKFYYLDFRIVVVMLLKELHSKGLKT
jgi:hypothetical protein